MSDFKGIAVIGLPTLAAIGVRSLVTERHDIRVAIYPTFDEYKAFEEVADGLVVSTEIFVANLDYFMPRRQKTLLYGAFRDVQIQKGYNNQEGDNLLPYFDDESLIGEKLDSLIDGIAKAGEERGELSAREKEVLRLLVAGKINKEIADELCISINTVITHRKNITVKTGIKSVSGLSIYALMNGIT